MAVELGGEVEALLGGLALLYKEIEGEAEMGGASTMLQKPSLAWLGMLMM